MGNWNGEEPPVGRCDAVVDPEFKGEPDSRVALPEDLGYMARSSLGPIRSIHRTHHVSEVSFHVPRGHLPLGLKYNNERLG